VILSGTVREVNLRAGAFSANELHPATSQPLVKGFTTGVSALALRLQKRIISSPVALILSVEETLNESLFAQGRGKSS
jgi:hypothetical protein